MFFQRQPFPASHLDNRGPAPHKVSRLPVLARDVTPPECLQPSSPPLKQHAMCTFIHHTSTSSPSSHPHDTQTTAWQQSLHHANTVLP